MVYARRQRTVREKRRGGWKPGRKIDTPPRGCAFPDRARPLCRGHRRARRAARPCAALAACPCPDPFDRRVVGSIDAGRASGRDGRRSCGRWPGSHALPGGGEADDRAAAPGAGRRAACAMSAIRCPSSWPTARRARARRPSGSRSTTSRMPSVVDGRTALAEGAPALWDAGAGQSRLPLQQGDHAAVAAGDEERRARRRRRRDQQPRHRGAARAACRHRALRCGDRHDGPRTDRAGAARHPPPARRVRLQGAARAHPASCARCRRRLRDEELPLSRMGAAAVGGAQARPSRCAGSPTAPRSS